MLAKVVDQQVARHGGEPGHKGSTVDVIAVESAVHFDEDFLGQVLGVVRRPGETIADVINAAMVALHDFLPRGRVSTDAAADETVDDLDVFQPALP